MSTFNLKNKITNINLKLNNIYINGNNHKVKIINFLKNDEPFGPCYLGNDQYKYWANGIWCMPDQNLPIYETYILIKEDKSNIFKQQLSSLVNNEIKND